MSETLAEKIQRLGRHVRAALQGQALDRQHDEEVRFHIESEATELMRVHGLSAAEAHRRALAAFGGVTQTRETYRDARGFPMLAALGWDIRCAVRALVRAPVFSLSVVAVLALGIGATTAAFALVNAVFLTRLPVRDQDRLVTLSASDQPNESPYVPWDVQEQLRERGGAVQAVTAYRPFVLPYAARYRDHVLHVTAVDVSGSFFDVLGVEPTVGRLIRPEDDVVGASDVVVLSDGLWRREFGGDPRVVGRSLFFKGTTFTIIGVAPPDFHFPGGTESWIPVVPAIHGIGLTVDQLRVPLVARLRPEEPRSAALAGLQIVLRSDSATGKYGPQGNPPGPVLRASGAVDRYADVVLGREVRPSVMVLFAAVVLVLAIACTNVAGLLLARGISRGPEFSLRTALGASRSRLLRSVLTESAVLGLLGGTVGLVLGATLLKLAITLAPTDLPMIHAAHLDLRVVAFAAAVTIGSVFGFGLAPSLSETRPESDQSLRAGTRATTSGVRVGIVRRGLVAAQVALALVILCGGGVLSRALYHLRHMPLGFDPNGLLFFKPDVLIPGSGFYPQRFPERFNGLRDGIARDFPKTPGLGPVTTAFTLPFVGGRLATTSYTVDGHLPTKDIPPRPTLVEEGLDDYFGVMKVPLVRGRGFTPHDNRQSPVVVVVNEALAREAWPGQDPIGHRVRVPDDSVDRFWTVIGVAADTRFNDLATPPRPTIYFPARQNEWDDDWFVVRTQGDPDAATKLVDETVAKIDPMFAVRTSQSGPDLLRERLARPRALAAVFDALAAAAVLLAAIGLFSVLSAYVRERRREIAIRSALGATPKRLRSLVVRQTVAVAAIGVACGMPLAFATSRLLYRTVSDVGPQDAYNRAVTAVRPLDALTLLLVALVLLAAVLIATYGPVARATSVDTRTALATE